ncbi:MAG: binding-protein-dependent transport system inner rane component [Solirubrobacterales bacterium]|nr:binding-protein-dependent transport system inner rane component [Solirubrobacterales bacterium]
MNTIPNSLPRRRALRRAHAGVPWLFATPALVAFAAIVVVPSLAALAYSFTDWTGLGAAHWVGFDNYSRTFSDDQASGSLRNTLLLTVAVVVAQNVLGLLLALGLERRFRGRNLLRTIFFAPVILSPVIIGYLWQYIYAPDGGLNRVLGTLHLEALQATWLGDPKIALWAVAATVVWQFAGYAMIIYSAGLEGVPSELKEAAALDGAGRFQVFRDVTLPLLVPAITINVALSLITGLKLFDQVLAMTGGGPGFSTETLSTVIYKQGFVNGRLGYSAALAVELGVAVAVLTTVQVLILRRREVRS